MISDVISLIFVILGLLSLFLLEFHKEKIKNKTVKFILYFLVIVCELLFVWGVYDLIV